MSGVIGTYTLGISSCEAARAADASPICGQAAVTHKADPLGLQRGPGQQRELAGG